MSKSLLNNVLPSFILSSRLLRLWEGKEERENGEAEAEDEEEECGQTSGNQ